MQLQSSWLCTAGLLSLQVSGTVAQLYNTVIETAYGRVQGTPAFNSTPVDNISDWQDITVWKGIPFAASTAGENRFRPPQKRAAWNDTLSASEFGGVCPQDFVLDSPLYYSEDCLNLNIWSAGNDTNAKLPVILWSYPAESTAAQPLFNGAGMAAKGIMFVNYNYRTGSLGWLATPELSEEMYQSYGTNSSGNWGMLDQFAALKWVYANIASFGGDPDHITVMGQSAGSAATYHMVNSPLTKGLIVSAIIESGVRNPHDPLAISLAEGYRNQSAAFTTSESYMESLNVTTIAEMRALSYEDLIISFMGTYDFGAVLDYYAMPGTYLNSLIEGAANDVPILTGNTKDESGAVAAENTTAAAYVQALETQYGSTFAAKFLALYPAANDSQADMSFNAHYRDTSRTGSWLWANLWAQSMTSDVYVYFWDHAPPGQDQGAYHESEINYVLNNLYDTDKPWEPEDFAIAEKMSSYWANFAKTGNPNTGGSYPAALGSLTYFPKSSPSKNVSMQVGDRWGDLPVATAAQIELIEEYFNTQAPI
jgi:carboxylesterase 2